MSSIECSTFLFLQPQPQQDGERRVRGVELVLPVVLGSCAFPLGKKATDAETHKWTVYVRGATPKKGTSSSSAAGQSPATASLDPAAIAAAGEDISDIVSKVVFNLHPTFHNPTREVSESPFELSEMGWGEFDLTAVLHFVDAAGEPPLELAHKLRLYSDADPQGTNLKKPVVAEVYDEVVFTEPREAFWRAASRAWGGGGGPGGNTFVGLRPSPRPYSTAAHFGSPAPEDELRRLGVARQRVAQVMSAVRKQMDQLDAHAAAGGSAAQFAQQRQQQRRAQQQMQMQQQQLQHQQAQDAAASAAAGLPPGFPPPEAMMM